MINIEDYYPPYVQYLEFRVDYCSRSGSWGRISKSGKYKYSYAAVHKTNNTMVNQPTTCTQCGSVNMNIVGWLFVGAQRLCPKCRDNQTSMERSINEDLNKQIEELKWLLSKSCQLGCSHDSSRCKYASTAEWEHYWKLRQKYNVD